MCYSFLFKFKRQLNLALCRKGTFHKLVREFNISPQPTIKEKIFLSKNYYGINYSINILHSRKVLFVRILFHSSPRVKRLVIILLWEDDKRLIALYLQKHFFLNLKDLQSDTKAIYLEHLFL